jgi:hypothetical protein
MRGKQTMRVAAFLTTAIVLLLPGFAVAQSSPPFTISREYRFAVIFPAETTAKDIT